MPTGKTGSRDSIRTKVFERKGVGFGEGKGKLSLESFPFPSPIFNLKKLFAKPLVADGLFLAVFADGLEALVDLSGEFGVVLAEHEADVLDVFGEEGDLHEVLVAFLAAGVVAGDGIVADHDVEAAVAHIFEHEADFVIGAEVDVHVHLAQRFDGGGADLHADLLALEVFGLLDGGVLGDDDGLILPPAVAPIQVVVVPIAAHKPGVSEKAAELAEKISKYARVKLDDSDNAPGWKFSQWEMKGVPLRLEIGPKDLEKNQCVLVRRDTREKVFVSLDELETAIPAQLEALRKDLYQRALENREKRTWAATTMDEVKELAKANTGYIKTMWCGDLDCELKMKEEAGLSSRCMPFEQEHLSDVCPCCGKPAKTMVYWGIAY